MTLCPPSSTGSADELDFDKTEKMKRATISISIFRRSRSPMHVAWDDSQHIDRLLAEVKDQPPGEYIPVDAEIASEPAEEHEHEHAAAPTAAEWTPDESYSMTASGREPGRKKSLAANDGDDRRRRADGPRVGLLRPALARHRYPRSRTLLAAGDAARGVQVAAKGGHGIAVADDIDRTPESTAPDSSTTPPAEETQQAKTTTTDTAVEPAAFNEPSAAPVKRADASPVQVTGAPSFTADELAAAHPGWHEEPSPTW